MKLMRLTVNQTECILLDRAIESLAAKERMYGSKDDHGEIMMPSTWWKGFNDHMLARSRACTTCRNSCLPTWKAWHIFEDLVA